MTVSALDHPYLKDLLGHDEVATFFSVEEDITAMIAFERALAKVEAEEGVISTDARDAIFQALDNYSLDITGLRVATARDGVVVPELLRQVKEKLALKFHSALHFGATSQDIIDTSLSLRLCRASKVIETDLTGLIEDLEQLSRKFGDHQIIGRTRMQRALPIPLKHRLDSWSNPLKELLSQFTVVRKKVSVLQFAGAVGTLENLGESAEQVRAKLATELNLLDSKGSWHTNRRGLVSFANWLSELSGSIGKLGQDVIQMSINEVHEVYLNGGGGSSAMPHKQNPVRGEVLVSLARFNAMNVSGMHQALVHENERSGSSWTLEWMILPQMVVAGAASVRRARELLSQIEDIPDMTEIVSE